MSNLRQPPVRILRRTQLRTGTAAAAPASAITAVPFAAAESPAAARVVAVAPGPATPPAAARPAASPLHVVDHAAAQHALAVLARRDTDHYLFRTTSRQLLAVLTLEAMRSAPTRPAAIECDRRLWTGALLAKPVVLLAVTRNGLGLSHNLLECVPGLLVGSISLERAPGSAAPQARLHLPNAPALSDCRVILFDPVIHSGNSVAIALGHLRQSGATDVSLVCFTVAAPGLATLRLGFPELPVWTTAVDQEWDAKRHPAGILGDFGARLFG